MKQAWMIFSVTLQFFNLEYPNVIFLWEAVVLDKPPIFQTKSNKKPTIWPRIGLLDIENTSVNPYGKFMVPQKNLWFSTEPYQIPKILPQIRVPRCRKLLGQPLRNIHGFSKNRCFFYSYEHTSKQTIYSCKTLFYEKEKN